MNEPRLRYRVDLYTDESLRWFAYVETHTNACTIIFYTRTADTPSGALELARQSIAEA